MSLSKNNQTTLTLNNSKVRIEVLKPVIERFLEKISVSNIKFYDNTPCWEWISSKTFDGYGTFKLNGKVKRSHRISYEYYIGKIPKGLELDHLCRNRACVNPKHLKAVTHKENVLRGIGKCAVNARKTHCIHGHEFTPKNTYTEFAKNGCIGRKCRLCHIDIDRRYRMKKKLIQ